MGVLRERVSDSQMGLEDGAGFIRISIASICTHKIYIYIYIYMKSTLFRTYSLWLFHVVLYRVESS